MKIRRYDEVDKLNIVLFSFTCKAQIEIYLARNGEVFFFGYNRGIFTFIGCSWQKYLRDLDYLWSIKNVLMFFER